MARELFFLQLVRTSPRGTNSILSCVLAVTVLNSIQKPQAQFSVCSVLEAVLLYRLTIPFRQSPLMSLSRMQKHKYLVASLFFFFKLHFFSTSREPAGVHSQYPLKFTSLHFSPVEESRF